MAVTSLLYGKFFGNVLGGETAGETRAVDILSDSIKVSLHTSSYVPNQDTHEFFSDLTNEVVGAGYSAGGVVLATKTWVYTAGTNTMTFDADDAAWPGSTITARFGVVYDDTPVGAGNKILIGYIDFGVDQATAGGTFTIQFNTSGIFTFTAA